MCYFSLRVSCLVMDTSLIYENYKYMDFCMSIWSWKIKTTFIRFLSITFITLKISHATTNEIINSEFDQFRGPCGRWVRCGLRTGSALEEEAETKSHHIHCWAIGGAGKSFREDTLPWYLYPRGASSEDQTNRSSCTGTFKFIHSGSSAVLAMHHDLALVNSLKSVRLYFIIDIFAH